MYHTIFKNLDYYVTDEYYNRLTNKESYNFVNSLDYLNQRPVFYFIYVEDNTPIQKIIEINLKKEMHQMSVFPPKKVEIFYKDENQKNPDSIIINSKYKIQIDNNEVYFAQVKEGEYI